MVTIKRETVKPQTTGVLITDFRSGESVKTETVNGRVVRRTFRGGLGGSFDPRREAQAKQAAFNLAKRRREVAQKEAKAKAQKEFLERQKLNRLQKERLDALAKLTKSKGAIRQRLIAEKLQLDRDITAASRKTFEAEKEKRRIANIPFIRRDLPKQDRTSFGVNQQTISIIEDIKKGKKTDKVKDFIDVISGGAITERDIQKDQERLNERVTKFNNRFTGKELSASEFSKTEAQQKFIDSEQKRIDNRTDKLVASKRNKFQSFLARFNINKTARLTVSEKAAVKKARDEDVKIQAKIKANQPLINKFQAAVDKDTTKIKKLQAKKNRNLLDEIKLIRLKNGRNTLLAEISALKFQTRRKVKAGTLPIIPASNIPAGITSIKFLGETFRATKGGKLIVDISFKTSRGTVGFARGVPAGVDKAGKTITVTAGRAGKFAVKFPTGKSKFIKIKSFIGVEKATTKSKIVKQIFDLEKVGKITGARAKSLRKFTSNIFKGGKIKKISLKNIRKTLAKLRKKKLKPLDLKKNLARLRRRAVKTKRIGKATRGRKRLRRPKARVSKPPKKIPSLVRKVEKKFREGDTLSKDLFIKKLRALKKNKLISNRKLNALIKRARKLAKKGKGRIARSEFNKIVKGFRKPGTVKVGKPPKDVGGLIGKRPPKIPKQIDLRKNIARLRKRGIISSEKAKQLRRISKVKRPKKLLDLRKNLARLRKRGSVIRATRDTAREPNFSKIVSNLRKRVLASQKSGRVEKIKNNLRILEQKAEGRVLTVKGKKFFKPTIKFPSGKLGKEAVKGISKTDFASVSSILTKDQLSFIIGNSITRGKAKSEFMGIIRGLQGSGGFVASSAKEAQQFQTALNKVISTVASAVAKAEKTKTLTKVARISTAGAILSASLRSGRVTARAVTKTKTVTQLARQGVVTKKDQKLITRFNKVNQKEKQLTKQIANLNQRARQLTKTKQRVRQSTKQKTKQKAKQRVRQQVLQKTAQLQKTRLRLRQQQKQITKQIQKAPTITTPPFTTRFIIPPKFKRKKKRKIIVKKKKGKNSFDVFARPLRKSKKGKKPQLIKVNKVPLSQTDARNLRNFIVDDSLSARGRVKVRGKGKPQKPKLKVPRGFAKRTSKKFRRFRTVKGKRVPLSPGSVIEKRSKRLDRKNEVKRIGLKRRIAQLRKQSKKKVTRRKVTRRKPTPKKPVVRKRSQAAINRQRLSNLVKARAARARIARSKRTGKASARTKLRRKISII